MPTSAITLLSLLRIFSLKILFCFYLYLGFSCFLWVLYRSYNVAMPSKYCCVGQDSECFFLDAKVNLLDKTMPVLCTHCCLLQEKEEKVEYKIFLNYSCCRECCCWGLTNYNAYKWRILTVSSSPLFFLSLLTLLVHQLKKALNKVYADCEAICQALHAFIEALHVSTACLEHIEKQAELCYKSISRF